MQGKTEATMKSHGQRAYEFNVADHPLDAYGKERVPWEQLSEFAKKSWEYPGSAGQCAFGNHRWSRDENPVCLICEFPKT
jgi:hypothetical protein